MRDRGPPAHGLRPGTLTAMIAPPDVVDDRPLAGERAVSHAVELRQAGGGVALPLQRADDDEAHVEAPQDRAGLDAIERRVHLVDQPAALEAVELAPLQLVARPVGDGRDAGQRGHASRRRVVIARRLDERRRPGHMTAQPAHGRRVAGAALLQARQQIELRPVAEALGAGDRAGDGVHDAQTG
jgi:hypothetical protein